MSAQEIIRVPILPFNMVNAHLIKSDAGCILVDTGIPGSERKIERVLKLAGVEFIDENGGGPGVRLRKRQGSKTPRK